ncbi:HET-domain-containing protein [Paraphaeosphaeria sporulosa]|uniref:HET-domain-containing protein n=1 Tax=Paraphaeosphaeria sporulosa TaxID=1460663 RepID=A0A177BVD8_9PLEO|nr:HET-domain-containing protein [Paraphaeosphaeria sporulosa]OAF99362.1 HET-domain-containing protein [Paraphaeosphaeria sporulosa]
MEHEHAEKCSLILQEGKCNCYRSEEEELFESKQAPFQPATKDGPADVKAHPDEAGWAAIREHVARKLRGTRMNDQNLSADLNYSPIDLDEIRVLELQRGDHGDPLNGSLHVANIDFAYPEVKDYKRKTNHAISLAEGGPVWYTALSYTWGDPIFDAQFHFANGTSIQITSSLASALTHLRSQTDSIFLWIDQICINQEDVQEKQKQIPLMGLIYSHATSTVIWLGDERGDDPQLAFDTLQTVHERLIWFDGEIRSEDFERLRFPAPAASEWVEVSRMFSRPWFERLWVVQEAVLSKNLYVKCGKAVVAWEDFALWSSTAESCGIGAFLADGAPATKNQSGLSTMNELSTLRMYLQTQETPSSLLEALVTTRYANASDVSVRDVFLEASIAEFPMEIFRLLSCVDHDRPVSPSWVPDWTLPRATESLGYLTRSWSLYSACGPMFDSATGKAYDTEYALEDSNTVLVIPGIVVDTIAAVGEPLDEEPFMFISDDNIRANPTWLSYLMMAKAVTSYSTGETVWDAFWKTLAAGKDGSSHGTTPQEYSEVLSLIVDKCMDEEQHIPGQPYTARRQKGFFTLKSLTSRKPKQTLDDMRKAFRSAMHCRAFAITRKGHFCLVPRRTKVNDAIVVLQGGHVPFVVRGQKMVVTKGFELIGETYVHGIMKGEAFDRNSPRLEKIRLI